MSYEVMLIDREGITRIESVPQILHTIRVPVYENNLAMYMNTKPSFLKTPTIRYKVYKLSNLHSPYIYEEQS